MSEPDTSNGILHMGFVHVNKANLLRTSSIPCGCSCFIVLLTIPADIILEEVVQLDKEMEELLLF